MSKVKQICVCAVLIALALVLGYMERFFPLQLVIPLPGIKLGLANAVTLVALYMFRTKYAFYILIPRCVLGALFGGGITSLMFSLVGGLLAMSTMALAKKLTALSIYGVSVLGAAAHNIGQIAVSMVLMRSVNIGGYLPYLLAISVVTGMLIATVCAGILRVLPKAFISVPTEMSR